MRTVSRVDRKLPFEVKDFVTQAARHSGRDSNILTDIVTRIQKIPASEREEALKGMGYQANTIKAYLPDAEKVLETLRISNEIVQQNKETAKERKA